VTLGEALNDFSARTTARAVYTVCSTVQSDPNTIEEEELLSLLEVGFGTEARSGWYDAKLEHISPAMGSGGMVC